MLLFRKIEIKNFVCFEGLTFDPSMNPERPLTVIRAENGSGKTTLLRAIRWGMYGERALPGDAKSFSLHPASWSPDAQGETTSVSIEFETDGSSREHPKGGPTHKVFNLRRKVSTFAAKSDQPGTPDFYRDREQVVLLERKADGSWTRYNGDADLVISELLPWDLRDFFVMDADEAADFVGGSENIVLNRREVIDKTTHAVNALLGLDVFKGTKQSLEKISDEFGRAATKATGNRDLVDAQDDLDRIREQLDEKNKQLRYLAGGRTDIEGRHAEARDRLESLVVNMSAHEELQHRRAENRIAFKSAKQRRKQALDALGTAVFDISLFGSLAAREVASTIERLQPLYDDGSIPVRHLDFVRSLVERGECICGQGLDAENEFGRRVQEALAQSGEQKERADWLSDVLDAAKHLHAYSSGEEWNSGCAKQESKLADVRAELDRLQEIIDGIDSKLEDVDDQQVQSTRDEIAMLDNQLDRIKGELVRAEVERDDLEARRNRLEGVVRAGQAGARDAHRHQMDQQLTDQLIEILNRSYSAIQNDQVAELDREMDRFFKSMAANVTDDGPVESSQHKATLAMIARTGLRPLDDADEKYEIFALNSRGRAMPPTEINGASRRILALSFVLALCEQSKTKAPLVADSLLNFTSGSVRTNTLRVTAETASQPILLLTGSDLEASQDAALVSRLAGATYTLTGQWQHRSQGGDVVNMTDSRKVALMCSCGPREFCSVCEREGQAEKVGWSRRQLSQSGER